LKGAWLGGAQVSELHANFIVNPEGKARASEIEMLMEKIQRLVSEKFGVQLVREVRIVGEKSAGETP
jgi:UDP-N-acetylmuramate dehydrogenase